MNETNCFNSTDIGFADMYTITTKEPGAEKTLQEQKDDGESGAEAMRSISWAGWLPLVACGLWVVL